MSKHIYSQFYGLPLENIVKLMIFGVIFWTILGTLLFQKYQKKLLWKSINTLGFIAALAAVGAVTLSERGYSETELILIPFHSFVEAQSQPELYRSMLMNVFLFFPLGLTLPYVIREKRSHHIRKTVLFAFVMSFAIECLQYHYHLGRAEIDDVLCNTLGAFLGTWSYWFFKKQHTKET